jgi:hypothetical protein
MSVILRYFNSLQVESNLAHTSMNSERKVNDDRSNQNIILCICGNAMSVYLVFWQISAVDLESISYKKYNQWKCITN